MVEHMEQEVQFIMDLAGDKSGRTAIPDCASNLFGPEVVLSAAGWVSASFVPMEDNYCKIW